MNRIFFAVLLLAGLSGNACNNHAPEHQTAARLERAKNDPSGLRDGDLIFQTSLSGQSAAIQLATRSRYSHCGIIYSIDGEYCVFEAVQPVRLTPLNEWIARGKNSEYAVRRLKEADRILTPGVLKNMKRIGSGFTGKNYDLAFEWSDEKLYCSELVWKIYDRAAGVQIGKLQHLSEFDLSHPAVKQKLRERYGNQIPLNETVVSPAAIFESELLVTVPH